MFACLLIVEDDEERLEMSELMARAEVSRGSWGLEEGGGVSVGRLWGGCSEGGLRLEGCVAGRMGEVVAGARRTEVG